VYKYVRATLPYELAFRVKIQAYPTLPHWTTDGFRCQILKNLRMYLFWICGFILLDICLLLLLSIWVCWRYLFSWHRDVSVQYTLMVERKLTLGVLCLVCWCEVREVRVFGYVAIGTSVIFLVIMFFCCFSLGCV
jgi:hypothetical protein